MKILAIETATEACSAALLVDGSIEHRYEVAPRQHGMLILKMVDELLAEAGLSPTGLDAVAFGRGPGSFTGVRIATGVVQGIAFGSDLAVAPVSTLAALANGAMEEENNQQVIAALDARMDQVYCGAYVRDANGLAQLIGEEKVCSPAEVERPAGTNWVGVGSGWSSYSSQLDSSLGGLMHGVVLDRYPHAKDVAQLAREVVISGATVAAEEAVPVYLRDNVAVKSKPV